MNAGGRIGQADLGARLLATDDPREAAALAARLDELNTERRDIEARVRTTAQTGVEMEALTAVSVTCLTVYDMVKAIDREMVIEGIRLTSKTGGTRGDWRRSEP